MLEELNPPKRQQLPDNGLNVYCISQEWKQLIGGDRAQRGEHFFRLWCSCSKQNA